MCGHAVLTPVFTTFSGGTYYTIGFTKLISFPLPRLDTSSPGRDPVVPKLGQL